MTELSDLKHHAVFFVCPHLKVAEWLNDGQAFIRSSINGKTYVTLSGVQSLPPSSLTDAQRLAIAVLTGETDAALVLADEVLGTFTQRPDWQSRKALVEALEPFAKLAKELDGDDNPPSDGRYRYLDSFSVNDLNSYPGRSMPTVADLRLARDVLDKEP